MHGADRATATTATTAGPEVSYRRHGPAHRASAGLRYSTAPPLSRLANVRTSGRHHGGTPLTTAPAPAASPLPPPSGRHALATTPPPSASQPPFGVVVVGTTVLRARLCCTHRGHAWPRAPRARETLIVADVQSVLREPRDQPPAAFKWGMNEPANEPRGSEQAYLPWGLAQLARGKPRGRGCAARALPPCH